MTGIIHADDSEETRQAPATTRLSRRRRCVLMMRAAGYGYAETADRLGITLNTVRKDLVAVNQTLLPGVTDGAHMAKGHRVLYVLGLLDAGVSPDEVADYLDALESRVEWLQGLDRARMDPEPDENPLARVASS